MALAVLYVLALTYKVVLFILPFATLNSSSPIGVLLLTSLLANDCLCLFSPQLFLYVDAFLHTLLHTDTVLE